MASASRSIFAIRIKTAWSYIGIVPLLRGGAGQERSTWAIVRWIPRNFCVSPNSARRSRNLRRAHVLRADTDPEQPRRNAAQRRKDVEQLEEQRRLRPLLTFHPEHTADDPLLDGKLKPLSETHRQGAPLLNGIKVVDRHRAVPERPGESIGRSHRILHRHIDADATDRRHRVGGIA